MPRVRKSPATPLVLQSIQDNSWVSWRASSEPKAPRNPQELDGLVRTAGTVSSTCRYRSGLNSPWPSVTHDFLRNRTNRPGSWTFRSPWGRSRGRLEGNQGQGGNTFPRLRGISSHERVDLYGGKDPPSTRSMRREVFYRWGVRDFLIHLTFKSTTIPEEST